jgi:hypothetical protein
MDTKPRPNSTTQDPIDVEFENRLKTAWNSSSSVSWSYSWWIGSWLDSRFFFSLTDPSLTVETRQPIYNHMLFPQVKEVSVRKKTGRHKKSWEWARCQHNNFIKTTYDISLDSQISLDGLRPFSFDPRHTIKTMTAQESIFLCPLVMSLLVWR